MTNYEEIDAQWNASYWADRAAEYRRVEAARQAIFAMKGQTVKVVAGRKVPVGTEGVVFWVGEGQWGWRLGFEDAEGTTHWTAVSNVEVVKVGVVHRDGVTLSGCCEQTVSRATHEGEWSCDNCYRVVEMEKVEVSV